MRTLTLALWSVLAVAALDRTTTVFQPAWVPAGEPRAFTMLVLNPEE